MQVVKVEKVECQFLWQAWYLVKVDCDFSWQAQHVVTFWEIAGARNVVFFNGNAFPRWNELGFRSSRCEMTILCSDVVGMFWNGFYIGESNTWIFVKNLAIRISWQAKYLVSSKGALLALWHLLRIKHLVMLESYLCCSTHCKWHFIYPPDQLRHSFCVAGAVFGKDEVYFFVAGAAFRDILRDSWSAKCSIFQEKCVSKMG